MITHCYEGITHDTQYYACYADLCMLRNLYAGITQTLRRHYAGITQSLGNLPLSDNYAVLRSHYAELRNRYAVLRSVTQCYAVLHSVTHHYAQGNLLMVTGCVSADGVVRKAAVSTQRSRISEGQAAVLG